MSPVLKHIILPAIAPALFFAVAAMPVAVLGCRNRGLLALMIALAGALAGLAAAFMGAKGRMRSDPRTYWWAASSLILAIPAVAVLILATAR
jgi:hypothetical protein